MHPHVLPRPVVDSGHLTPELGGVDNLLEISCPNRRVISRSIAEDESCGELRLVHAIGNDHFGHVFP